MRPATLPSRVLRLTALAAVALVSCTNDPFDPDSLPNQTPVARVSVEDGAISPTSYNEATFHWSGSDVDGFLRGFHVAIRDDVGDDPEWTFTTSDETTRTYTTDALGEAAPTLFVVAEDNRFALSDTVSVTFPLVNFPPTLEFHPDFDPPGQSFGAASFDFFGFDLDGDATVLRTVDHRFAGSDPDVVFEPGDPDADPAVGWVRRMSNPTRFSLELRDIPGGEGEDSDQTLYVRIRDEAGGEAILEYQWQNFEAVGKVLLVDDNPTSASRDAFYRDALEQLLPGAHSVWDISGGLPSRDTDLRLTLEQFDVLVWYTSNGESENLLRTQSILQEYLAADLDPDTPGVQEGRLLLETYTLVLPFSRLNAAFRRDILGLDSLPDPRNQMVPFTGTVLAALGGALDIESPAGLPTLQATGLDYLGGAGLYFGLFGLSPLAGSSTLWTFESYTWGGPGDPFCRLGCTPTVAVRRPDTGLAKTITLGFQLEYANAGDNAIDALHTLLTDHLGVTP